MMKQNLDELTRRIFEFNKQAFQNSVRGKVQRIISTDDLICFAIRFLGQTEYLYLGRGSGIEGAWGGDSIPPVQFRCIDRYLEYLRKNLKNANISKLRVDNSDRILMLTYKKKNISGEFAFFWKGPKLYFCNQLHLDSNKFKIFKSWEKGEKICYERNDIPECFDQVGRRSEKVEAFNKKTSSIEVDLYLKQKVESCKSGSRRPKKIKKMIKKSKMIEKDLHKIQCFKSVGDLLDGDKLNLKDIDCFIHEGIKVKFPKEWNEYKKRDKVYEKIKRLKRAEKIQLARLKECQKLINSGADLIDESKVKKIFQPVWFVQENKVDKSSSLNTNRKEFPIESFNIADTIKLIVGKDATSNDHMRKVVGNKNDYWFHVDGYKGCHGIIKMSDKSTINELCFQVIGSILRDVSRLRILSIPLVYTQLKNVKGVKGFPGKVIYKKEKYINVDYLSNWKKKVII